MDFKSASDKVLWTSLLLVLSLGYAFAAVQVCVAVGIAPDAVLSHYQGNEAEMMTPMPLDRLVMLSHVHMSAMAWLVFPAALVFSRSRLRESLKAAVIAATFLGIALDVGAWWGVRYLGGPLLAVLLLGGGLMGGGFLFMTATGLIHIWRKEE